MEPPTLCSTKIKISIAVIGIIVGVGVFFCFGLVYHNWDAAVWGLLSGLIAGLTLFVHIQYLRDIWKVWVHRLRPLMLVGCVLQLAGVCGFVAYLSIAIVEKQGLTAYGAGYYVACVWCFMTWKWGFQLFYFSRQYKRLYEDQYQRSADDGYQKI